MDCQRIRSKIRKSNFYTFRCLTPKTTEDQRPHSINEPGYTRIVHCNRPLMHLAKPFRYCSNYVSTTRYNMLTFLPKSLYEQFRRVANISFLITAILSVFSFSPFNKWSMIAPFILVVGLSIFKEGVEDWSRFMQDVGVNSRKVSVHKGRGEFGKRKWNKIRVGDVVRVEKDEIFPADLLLLSSSYEDGICYVETMNLDGETNLKAKRCLDVTLPFENDESFQNFSGTITCEDPNPDLYTFVGNLECEGQVHPLDPSQILLRDSKLRNTAYIYGVVIFTGHDTKVMQNATISPSKRSRIEKRMDRIICILLGLLLVVSLISSIGFALMTHLQMSDWWYIQPEEPDKLTNPTNPAHAWGVHFATALLLYGYLIPISLYVSIEVVKLLQATFINRDLHMYDSDSETPARARTSNLNEELGQVHTILSDKTGTLTCNQMDFLKCSIAGISYGVRASEVEVAAARQMEMDLEEQDRDTSQIPNSNSSDIELETVVTARNEEDQTQTVVTARNEEDQAQTGIKGFSFEDNRLMDGNWLLEPRPEDILMFFRILGICHTAIPEVDEDTGKLTYEAESPDEVAFLVAAREFGFEFTKRTQSSVFISEISSSSGQPVEREYKILNILDFTSKRKRMSVIIRDEEGQILLLCKGADSIIFDRLAKKGNSYLGATTKHLNEYGEAGLRTLALAYKILDETEYSAWNSEFLKAKTFVGSDRDAMLEKVSDVMERELILVGATAVEDKLQKGVPQCIDKLAQAGLKIWVLTGDKLETAINIGYACSLLRQGMKQISIALTDAEESSQDLRAVKESILMQITNAAEMIKTEREPHAAFALIIEGKTLTYALEDDVKSQFIALAVDCASVICCRVTPKQKALVTRLVKEGTKNVTLAIGDGANDVGMIQEADIGVGISGVEGMQAVMASDFSIAQFRFLERLLVVHGHWCYKRLAQMICYFFYKNVAFGITLFFYEAYTKFSGQSIYNDPYLLLFNVVLTSLPVISLGVFEQDVPSDVCLQFPALYQQGPKNLFFDWCRILWWMVNGVYSSIIIFSLNIGIFYVHSFRYSGQPADMNIMGTIMFTCIVWVVNVQIALTMSHFTWIQHFLIWGSIALWYIILFLYGMLPPKVSLNIFHILVETLAPAPIFWLTTLLVIVAAALPYSAHILYQRMVNPLDHHIIQEIKHYKYDAVDEQMWRRECSRGRETTKIGFTARVDAKIRQLRGMLQGRPSVSRITSSQAGPSSSAQTQT